MDETSYEFKTWPDQIINLIVTSSWLLKSFCLTGFSIINSLRLNWIVMKLADKD